MTSMILVNIIFTVYFPCNHHFSVNNISFISDFLDVDCNSDNGETEKGENSIGN